MFPYARYDLDYQGLNNILERKQRVRLALCAISKSAKDKTHTLRFNHSWTYKKERPTKTNKTLGYELSTFT